MCTRTEWYVVPIFWAPITIYLFLRSLFQFTGPLPTFFENPTIPLSHIFSIPADSIVKTMLCFFLGNLVWTILEYTLHRFLFHVDRWLPDKPLFLMLHFTAHGVHHYLPMDRYVTPWVYCWVQTYLTMVSKFLRLRLVMPPPLFFILQLPFTQLAYAIFPVAIANGIISGSFTFCRYSSLPSYPL